MKTETKKRWVGYISMIVIGILWGVACLTFERVPTAVGPIATVLGWIVMQIVSRVR